ncbi:MAG: IS1 family transposase [Planctomycetaceae bacterium]
MNTITTEKRCEVVRALVEGCSIRSIVRMTGVSKNAVARLLVALGCKCAEYQDATLRNLTCRRLQVDEIWSFVGCKEKNVATARNGGIGDVWTWVAIDADTKLVPSWLVGDRDGQTARIFINDLASRLKHRVQVTSDGHRPYLEAVEEAFGWDVDYAMLVKIYGKPSEEDQRKYSPAQCVGCSRHIVTGQPDPEHISTSFAERQNLTMRMKMRRFTRLTNAFSKKIENHCHSVALHYMHYNFARVHQSLRCSPAMKAGVTDRLWSIEDIVALLAK